MFIVDAATHHCRPHAPGDGWGHRPMRFGVVGRAIV
jgi:hypothetical protein